jgi:hypothetical protein
MTETTLVRMNVKDGQVSFTDLPNGIVVEINNYDTGIPPKATLEPEKILEGNLLQDNNGAWYQSHSFSNTETLVVPETEDVNTQVEMGI